MKCFITKYTLTSGIIEVKDCEPQSYEPSSPSDSKYVYGGSGFSRQQFVVGRDAFEHEADAIAAVNTAVTKKIASLKKQIAKLEKMTFEVKP